MINIKDLIETTTQIPTADTAFKDGHKLPFCVYLDRQDVDGDDVKERQTVAHNLVVEFYAAKIDATNEMKLEALFRHMGWEYGKERTFLPDEKCFETIYELDFTERK